MIDGDAAGSGQIHRMGRGRGSGERITVIVAAGYRGLKLGVGRQIRAIHVNAPGGAVGIHRGGVVGAINGKIDRVSCRGVTAHRPVHGDGSVVFQRVNDIIGGDVAHGDGGVGLQIHGMRGGRGSGERIAVVVAAGYRGLEPGVGRQIRAVHINTPGGAVGIHRGGVVGAINGKIDRVSCRGVTAHRPVHGDGSVVFQRVNDIIGGDGADGDGGAANPPVVINLQRVFKDRGVRS